jgi:hypothetical protein
MLLRVTYILEFLALFGLGLGSKNTHFFPSLIHLQNSQSLSISLKLKDFSEIPEL